MEPQVKECGFTDAPDELHKQNYSDAHTYVLTQSIEEWHKPEGIPVCT